MPTLGADEPAKEWASEHSEELIEGASNVAAQAVVPLIVVGGLLVVGTVLGLAVYSQIK